MGSAKCWKSIDAFADDRPKRPFNGSAKTSIKVRKSCARTDQFKSIQ